jgi:hypothetical protein
MVDGGVTTGMDVDFDGEGVEIFRRGGLSSFWIDTLGSIQNSFRWNG